MGRGRDPKRGQRHSFIRRLLCDNEVVMTPRDDASVPGSSAGSSRVIRFPNTPSQSIEEADVRAKDVETEGVQNQRELLKEQRKPMVAFLKRLSACWLAGCAFLLLLQGFSRLSHFHLGDSVLIAAITATTANVLAMLVVVVKFIFPDRK
jgi:hypothetical protein